MGVTIFVLFALCFKQSKMFAIFTCITAVILLCDLVCLLIYKENALIEALPIFAGYVLLGVVNVRSDNREPARQTQ
jgi:hypothetical protein